MPYTSHSLKDVCTGIVQGTLSLQMDAPRDDELESLISACMDRSPDLRPTIDEIHKTITEHYEHLSNLLLNINIETMIFVVFTIHLGHE